MFDHVHISKELLVMVFIQSLLWTSAVFNLQVYGILAINTEAVASLL